MPVFSPRHRKEKSAAKPAAHREFSKPRFLFHPASSVCAIIIIDPREKAKFTPAWAVDAVRREL
jgi:hypothetical protein